MHRSGMTVLRGWRWIVSIVVIAFVMPAPAAEAPVAVEPVGTAKQQSQWLEGLSLLGSGHAEKGRRIIHALATEGVTDPRVQNVESWLAEFDKAQLARDERVQADYERYAAWAQEDRNADRWTQAVLRCSQAFKSAKDEDAFRTESWVIDLVAGADEAARAYQTEKKWYKAAGIYLRLTEVFPHNKTYREALEHCQDHIRLELTYAPDADWEGAVKDIIPDMARDAFRRIESDYLKEAAFKDAVVGALKQILRLTAEPKLTEVFKRLSDQDTVDEFVSRVTVRLKRAQDADELSAGDLIDYFDRILQINEELDLLPPEVLIHEFVYGALQPLDKFSDMIWPADVLEFTKHTQGRFSGVGIQIRKDAGEPILVVTPLKDSPAYAKGVRPGDLITKIDGRSASKYTITRAVREITGPVGTPVTLTMKRDGQEFDVRLIRQEIVIEKIKSFERDGDGNWKFMLDPQQRIGYVRLTGFTENSFEQLESVIRKLAEQGMRGLIFDLRDNPGGPLTASIQVADLFLETGKQIVSTRNREGDEWQAPTSGASPYTDFPMIVLISEYSASASEIVAGALQVHNRALLLGERTYGKGSVQQVLPLNHSRMASLKLTTQHYYLPDGRCLHREEDSTTWGVDPDVVSPLVPKERVKLYDLQLKQDIIKGKDQENLSDDELRQLTDYGPSTKPSDGDSDDTENLATDGTTTAPSDATTDADEEEDDEEEYVKREDPNDHPDRDPQLEQALMLMRIRLESSHPWPAHPIEMAATEADSPGG